MKVNGIVSIAISVVLMFLIGILGFSLVEYYDVTSIIVVGAPLLVIARFADLNIRDYITRERHMQILISTFVTTLLVVGLLVGAFFIYTNVLNNMDIYKTVIEALNITPLLKYVQ